MNTKQTLDFLTVPEEQVERQAATEGIGLLLVKPEALETFPTIKLKRSFNQGDGSGNYIRFWRIMGPNTHPNLGSDISVMWLKENRYVQ